MLSRNLEQTLHRALSLASERRHEYATLEHLLLSLADDSDAATVLRACGVEEDMAHSSIRFGIGRFNTEEEIDYVGRLVVEKVSRLREMSPLYEMAKEGVDLKSIEWAAH